MRAADALVAVGGGLGTLSEVALGLKAGKRVVGVAFPFALDDVEAVDSAPEAVERVLAGC